MSATPPTIIVTTPEQLTKLIRDAVEQVLAEQSQDTAPRLLDRNGIAQALAISVSMIDRLRREGLPHFFLGESPRFLADECLNWLKQHRRGAG